MTSRRKTTGLTSPDSHAELNAALQGIAERQVELHREFAGLARVQSALVTALRSRTAEPCTVSEESGDAAPSAGEFARAVLEPAPYYFDLSGVDLSGCRNYNGGGRGERCENLPKTCVGCSPRWMNGENGESTV